MCFLYALLNQTQKNPCAVLIAVFFSVVLGAVGVREAWQGTREIISSSCYKLEEKIVLLNIIKYMTNCDYQEQWYNSVDFSQQNIQLSL
jgi:hypothetical protein